MNVKYMYNECIDRHKVLLLSMNNNNTGKRKKKNKEKKDFSSKNKIPKRQNATRKADVVDISSGIIDIDETPDVATWNKESQIKEDAVGVIVNRLGFPEPRPRPPTTSSPIVI